MIDLLPSFDMDSLKLPPLEPIFHLLVFCFIVSSTKTRTIPSSASYFSSFFLLSWKTFHFLIDMHELVLVCECFVEYVDEIEET